MPGVLYNLRSFVAVRQPSDVGGSERDRPPEIASRKAGRVFLEMYVEEGALHQPWVPKKFGGYGGDARSGAPGRI